MLKPLLLSTVCIFNRALVAFVYFYFMLSPCGSCLFQLEPLLLLFVLEPLLLEFNFLGPLLLSILFYLFYFLLEPLLLSGYFA